MNVGTPPEQNTPLASGTRPQGVAASHEATAQALNGTFHLAYCSLLTAQTDAAALRKLVDQAQALNLKRGITGLMMVDGQLVVQWIEGPETAIAKLWQSLQRDPRHHCLALLVQKPSASGRLFPDWQMERLSRTEMLDFVCAAKDSARAASSDPMADAIDVFLAVLNLPQPAQPEQLTTIASL